MPKKGRLLGNGAREARKANAVDICSTIRLKNRLRTPVLGLLPLEYTISGGWAKNPDIGYGTRVSQVGIGSEYVRKPARWRFVPFISPILGDFGAWGRIQRLLSEPCVLSQRVHPSGPFSRTSLVPKSALIALIRRIPVQSVCMSEPSCFLKQL